MSEGVEKTIENATPEELMNALIDVSDTVERDYKGFVRGYSAAVAVHTDINPSENIDEMAEEVKRSYQVRLESLAENGELEELLEDVKDE